MTRLMLALIAFAACGAARATCIYHALSGQAAGRRHGDLRRNGRGAEGGAAVPAKTSTPTASCLDLEMTTFEKSGEYDENRLTELRAMQAKKNNAAVDEVQCSR